MVNRQVSADEIRRTLLSRINKGQYVVGSRIPPARVLAQELGANRNTIGKAFQELARAGVVSLAPGRGGGAFVQRANAVTDIAAETLRVSLQPLVAQAREAGLSKAQVGDVVHHVINEAYTARDLQIKFLECNEHDAHELVRQLTGVIDCQIDPGVIDQEDIPSLADHYPLIVTTFHHLAEVSRKLNGQRDKVIGVNAVPTSEVALQIALLEAQRIGLVCGRENTVQSMKYLVGSYHPQSELDVALVDAATNVQALAQHCDALIVTYSCADTVIQLTKRVPDVVVEFQLEAQSVEFLRQRVHRLHTEHLPDRVDAVA
jgi:GntR family transcriptional regulator